MKEHIHSAQIRRLFALIDLTHRDLPEVPGFNIQRRMELLTMLNQAETALNYSNGQ